MGWRRACAMISSTMKLIRLLALGVVFGAVYVRFLRSPILNWGATAAETGAPLPGDELLADPSYRRHASDRHRGTGVCRLALDRPDGAFASWRRLHT